MATLLSAVTANTTGTGASHTGPCTVFVSGTFGGATVVLQVADADAAGKYVNADAVGVPNQGQLSGPGAISLNCYGTYYVRAILGNAGSTTSVTAISTQ